MTSQYQRAIIHACSSSWYAVLMGCVLAMQPQYCELLCASTSVIAIADVRSSYVISARKSNFQRSKQAEKWEKYSLKRKLSTNHDERHQAAYFICFCQIISFRHVKNYRNVSADELGFLKNQQQQQKQK